jgi:hypothetical protein
MSGREQISDSWISGAQDRFTFNSVIEDRKCCRVSLLEIIVILQRWQEVVLHPSDHYQVDVFMWQ